MAGASTVDRPFAWHAFTLATTSTLTVDFVSGVRLIFDKSLL
jgi:hypothetical protein